MTPEQRIAIAVIHQTVRDLACPVEATRASARTFLAGSASLNWWASMADVAPDSVMAYARRRRRPKPPRRYRLGSGRRAR